MVAYSFQKQFEAPIRLGTKSQTIRRFRKRHARPGEQVQLYYAMRTKHCRLIGTATVSEVYPVRLIFSPCINIDTSKIMVKVQERWEPLRLRRDVFAQRDGFTDWHEMREFWALNHPDTDDFEGVVIKWEEFNVHQG